MEHMSDSATNGDTFFSSDAVRHARPLPHAQTVRFDDALKLTSGGTLPDVTVAYETYGTLNEQRDNAVLICHALSGDSHVARHDAADDAGWWEAVVGPGKAIDTDRFFVICPNVLGGCRGTTGPNCTSAQTGRPYGADFPVIAVEDMVDVQRMLIDRLGIDKLLAVTGGSLGGHQALCWATRYPDRVGACMAIATSARLTSQALAFDVVGRNAILRDPHFSGGQYYDQAQRPDVGLALARMLGHITYLSRESMTAKFDADRYHPREVITEFEKEFNIGSYLAYQGDKFVERFDANSYITLSMAMDLFDLGATTEQLRANLARAACRWLIVSFTSDWLFPAEQSRELVDALIAAGQPVSYCNITSDAGHDTFLLEDNLDVYGRMLGGFLLDRLGVEASIDENVDDDCGSGDPTSIFHRQRLDYDLITQLIDPGAAVLDLGCGSGVLLERLARRGHEHVVGVELDERAIVACVQRGLDVIQADLNEGLPDFADRQFDYVVLSQTLQSIVRTEAMVDEILRVGRRCVVTFPNFAYRAIRHVLMDEGRSPSSKGGLLHFAWHQTPNRRFLSVLDWQEFCAARHITIHREVFLDTTAGSQITDDPNLNADLAIFVISR